MGLVLKLLVLRVQVIPSAEVASLPFAPPIMYKLLPKVEEKIVSVLKFEVLLFHDVPVEDVASAAPVEPKTNSPVGPGLFAEVLIVCVERKGENCCPQDFRYKSFSLPPITP